MSLLPDRSDARDILAIGGPAILGLSSQMIVSVVDTAMVGRLDNAPIALAAMGLGMLATWAITSFFSSLSTGTHVLVARRYGEGKPESAGEVLNNSLVVCFLLGVVVAAIGYLSTPAVLDFFAKDRAVAVAGTPYMQYRFLGLPFFLLIVSYRGFFYGIGDTKVFMYSAIIVNVANIVLNYLLIFGALGFPRMELAGAGLASTIATVLGCLFFVAVTLLRTYRTTFRYFAHMRFAKDVIKLIVNISLPVSFQNLLILIGFLSFVAITGIVGTTEQAASQVVITALFMSFLPCFGLGIAAQTLVGQMLGRDLPERARAYGFATAKLATLFTIGIGALFVFLPEAVLIVVTTDRSVIQVARPVLQIAGVAQAFYGSGIIYANALQAAGETLYVMIVEVITHWVLFLPCAFLFGITLGGGILGAWLALPLYILVYSSLNFLKFRSTSWMAKRI
jgi:putative MATE family efflux protein